LGRLRPLNERDIDQTANLHQEVFDIAGGDDIADRYARYFMSTFLCPRRQFDSIVYEEADGRITGFLGVVTREFTMEDKRVRGALSTQLVVRPEARRRLIGLALLRHFLLGPQDFAFTDEANDASRKMWERLGGSTSPLYSTHWTAPVRPLGFALSRMPSPMRLPAKLAWPLAAAFDAAFLRVQEARLKSYTSGLDMRFLDTNSLSALVQRQTEFLLKPLYDAQSLQGCLDHPTRSGFLRDSRGEIAGWYIYHLDDRKHGEVLQIGCRNDTTSEVVAHLFENARHNGALVLYGRLEPHFSDALPRYLSILSRRRHAMLVHSRDPKILAAIHSGKAFLSRLDGEWRVRFSHASSSPVVRTQAAY
jgi:ribosomal protein S18 acetylase RimI-like enzyme